MVAARSGLPLLGDTYVPQHGVTVVLTYDEIKCQFEFKDCDGGIWEFNPEGMFKSYVSPGKTASSTVTAYTASGLPKTVSCTVIQNGVTTQSQILDWFGVAFKEGRRNGNPMWTYQFDAWSSFGKDKSKELIILFDKDNIVRAYRYASNMD